MKRTDSLLRRRRLIVLLASASLLLAAVVSGYTLARPSPAPLPVSAPQQVDAGDVELAQEEEDEADDCAQEPPDTHGGKVCRAAQAWKLDPNAERPPADHGRTVSEIARQNHGADIAAQKDGNGGLPDAARDALERAGLRGGGPPNWAGDRGADDDDEEEGEDEE